MFDLFKIGIGPSSSHTLGPMLAGKRFTQELKSATVLHSVKNVSVELYGSLALTGKKHDTDKACVLGLMGFTPQTVDPLKKDKLIETLKSNYDLALGKYRHIRFDMENDLIFHFDKILPEHANGLVFTAKGEQDEILLRRTYFSVGGGFVVAREDDNALDDSIKLPFSFSTAEEMLALCQQEEKTIEELVFANELARAKAQNKEARMEDIYKKADKLWTFMAQSIQQGMKASGDLPGPLKIKRRAKEFHQSIIKQDDTLPQDSNDWVNLFAMAVSEENAAGGRIVTAPTNGAAGIIPAVLGYYDKFVSPNNKEGIRRFLATATAIGSLYKKKASIMTLEVGCQGEIGVACSMAAAGLAAAKGGTAEQIEKAAEIGMDNNLGLTCDPLEGFVQIPCIERNTMGAVKAINAARLALRGEPRHYVSLDATIQTMYETAKDMQSKYKQTSKDDPDTNNITVNIINC